MAVLAYVIHLLEEFFVGGGLPQWFTEFLGSDLSNLDFLIINGIFLLAVIVVAIATLSGRKTELAIFALGVLFFGNACAHLLASIFTMAYAPGVISGVLIYWPLGIYIFRKIYPILNHRQQTLGIIIGIGIQVVVHFIARTI